MSETELTHKRLVKAAGRWLRNTIGCSVVMEEFTAYCLSNEIPDAIGWHQKMCILVEVKMSRADFRADRKKPARRPDAIHALGSWRFYVTPPGLIRPDEIPEGWGLYELHRSRAGTYQMRHAGGSKWANAAPAPFLSCKHSEVGLLLSALRRLEISTAVFIRHEDGNANQGEQDD